jgi:hypothetical protein
MWSLFTLLHSAKKYIDISGSHGRECEDDSLLGFSLPLFNHWLASLPDHLLLPHLSGQVSIGPTDSYIYSKPFFALMYTPLKRRYTSIRLCSAIPQKALILKYVDSF